MIDVYSWPTPNGHKVHIMLEECGLRLGRDWRVHPVNIGQGDQFRPEFLTISPNNKIPALVDPVGPDGKPISLFESGAILLYLAAKTGKLLPTGNVVDALEGIEASCVDAANPCVFVRADALEFRAFAHHLILPARASPGVSNNF